jgi:branched-chain amino acid transport system permease protein
MSSPARICPAKTPFAGLVRPRFLINAGLVLILALIPVYAAATGDTFALTLFTRVVVLAMAALSLNLIMGFGGMVSFGHAAYLGIGAYAVGILAKEGIGSGFVQWPVAVAASAFYALIVGALSLRTRGVYFIMITLAFAQMVYYVAIGLDRYGGDDGLTIYHRSTFGGLVDLNNKALFYYLCLVLLLASIYLVWRIVNSRFGMVIQGARSNERRMRAIGFPTFRYRLVCFVIAGAMCGLAGALLANHTDFISPAMMHWTRSGDLIVMVVLGGMQAMFGPLIGAMTFLILEEGLSRLTEYSNLILGPFLLVVAISIQGGIDGLIVGRRHG